MILSVIKVRPIHPSDAHSIKAIEERCGLSSWPRGEYEREAERPDTVSLVATIDESHVGFVIARMIGDTCEILNLAVIPEMRRRGVGRELMRACFAEVAARGGQQICLEVREGNIDAIGFYEGFGFTARGLRRNFYTHPTEHAVLMQTVVK